MQKDLQFVRSYRCICFYDREKARSLKRLINLRTDEGFDIDRMARCRPIKTVITRAFRSRADHKSDQAARNASRPTAGSVAIDVMIRSFDIRINRHRSEYSSIN